MRTGFRGHIRATVGNVDPRDPLTITVAPVPDDIPEYDRSDWRHWVDADGDCQDARQEVLVEESLVSVTFETDRGCRVATGQWYGAFTGVYTGDPGDLDIDHLVPLKNAHLSGGWRWDAEMREEYANDMSDPDHLIANRRGQPEQRDQRSGDRQTWTTGASTPRTGRK